MEWKLDIYKCIKIDRHSLLKTYLRKNGSAYLKKATVWKQISKLYFKIFKI